MGMNHYAHIDPCPTCHRSTTEIHLGKSSGGWRFCIEVQKEYYTNWTEFLKFIEQDNVTIKDEENKERSVREFVSLMYTQGDDERQIDGFQDGPADFVDRHFT